MGGHHRDEDVLPVQRAQESLRAVNARRQLQQEHLTRNASFECPNVTQRIVWTSQRHV